MTPEQCTIREFFTYDLADEETRETIITELERRCSLPPPPPAAAVRADSQSETCPRCGLVFAFEVVAPAGVDEAFDSLARYCTFLADSGEPEQFRDELARLLSRPPDAEAVRLAERLESLADRGPDYGGTYRFAMLEAAATIRRLAGTGGV
jgi:hypothetical protein